MKALFLHLIRSVSGAAVVEAAVVTPLAVALMAGGVEFGRAIFSYHTVDKSLRNATRYLTRVPKDAVNGWALTRARNLALTGTTDGSGAYILNTWTDPNTITIVPAFDPSAAIPTVRLTAAVPFTFAMLPASNPLLFGSGTLLTIRVTHEERHIGE